MAVEDAFVPYSTMTAPPLMDAEVVVEEAVGGERYRSLGGRGKVRRRGHSSRINSRTL